MNKYPWSKPDVVEKLGKTILGREAAEKLAIKLQFRGALMPKAHKDFCGYGLVYEDGKYLLLSVQDGLREYSSVIYEWKTKEEFISYMEQQSDYSLSGADKNSPLFYTTDSFSLNNQCLTVSVLRGHARCTT